MGESESKLPDTDRDGGLSCPLQVVSTKQFHTDFLLAGDCLFSSLSEVYFLSWNVSLIFLQSEALSYTYTLTHRFVRAK